MVSDYQTRTRPSAVSVAFVRPRHYPRPETMVSVTGTENVTGRTLVVLAGRGAVG